MISGLDPVIHAPKRLAVMAMLANAQSVDFRFLRDHLRVSDSDLSKQMTALESAGYVEIRKTGRGRGATTSLHITDVGRTAFDHHRQALRTLLADKPK